MTEEKNPGKKKTQRLPRWIAREIRRNFPAAIGGVIATIGISLSPLKDIALHWILPEHPQLLIIPSNNKIDLGDEFDVSVLIASTGIVPVSEGSLRLEFDNEGLIAKSGKTIVNTPSIESPRSFPDEKLVLYSAKNGTYTLKAILDTKYGSYNAETEVQVKHNFSKPTRGNFSGKWHLSIQHSKGEMEIVQREVEISGFYNLDNGEAGKISGYIDGTTFRVTFHIDGRDRAKRELEGTHGACKGYLEISGKSNFLLFEKGKWSHDGTAENFYAVASAPTSRSQNNDDCRGAPSKP